MKKILILTLAIFIILTLPAAAEEPTAEQSRITGIEKARAATVSIMVNLDSLGSGFFVSENYVLTAYHVVDDNKMVHVSDERMGGYHEVVAVDKKFDLALIKLTRTGTPLKVVDRVKVGQDAYMIGYPKIMDKMVTAGIISHVYDDSKLRGVIADISAYEASSGSPIINSDGEVIGMLKGLYEDDTRFMLAIHPRDIRNFLQRNGVPL